MGSRIISQGIFKESLLHFLRFSLVIVLLVEPIVLSSCSYHPWKVERYVNEKTEYIDVVSTIPDKYTFGEFYFENNFVDVFLRGKDETWYSGKGPYDLYIRTWKIGSEGGDDRLCLKEINIHSSMGRPHDPAFLNQFPVVMLFEKATYYNQMTQTDEEKQNLSFADVDSQKPLDLDFDGGETVVIELIFELVRPDSTSLQKTINYEFKPKLEKGNFVWITA